MKDQYEEVWDAIGKALSQHAKMILWIAERTLSIKEYKEFIDTFAKKPNSHDEVIDFLRHEGR